MAEPLSTSAQTIPDNGPPPAADEFPGCRAVRIPLREIEDFDGRLEYRDARNEIAFVAEAASPHHEYRKYPTNLGTTARLGELGPTASTAELIRTAWLCRDEEDFLRRARRLP